MPDDLSDYESPDSFPSRILLKLHLFAVTGLPDPRFQPLHYRFNRQLTVRELARLSSFPDKFVFLGSTRDQKGQIGNAVPPLLALALAKEIRKVL